MPKTSDHFHALGAVDELNAVIGMAREHCRAIPDDDTVVTVLAVLTETQSRLMDVGAAVATPLSHATDEQQVRTAFAAEAIVTELESNIDQLDAHLEPLTQFILPSGGLASASLHQARAVCRRAEREVIQLAESGDVDQGVVRYLNRLSDFLFVAARSASKASGEPETVWTKVASNDADHLDAAA